MFLFRIRPLVCTRQNQSVTKTFRIPGAISSSVNLVLQCSTEQRETTLVGVSGRFEKMRAGETEL